MAAVRANEQMEDFSHVETGRNAVFAGIYDGHAGDDAARYLNNFLFEYLIGFIQESRDMSEVVLRDAVVASEVGFLEVVRHGYVAKPNMGKVGSCCLVCCIWRNSLYIANLGDSRAVLGTLDSRNRITPLQLNQEHNLSINDVRNELRLANPDDPGIVVHTRGAWRVKGIIEVTRTIGDAYLKRPPFTLEPNFPDFQVPKPFERPVLSAEPFVHTRALRNQDKFVILASDGLWDHISSQEAVNIVQGNPRNGIAKRLVKTALRVAAGKMVRRYRELVTIEPGKDGRRTIHDDISVIVIFINHQLLGTGNYVPELSFKGFVDNAFPSDFRKVRDLLT
ncbi:hypothetical protein SESBI_27350 [Sesbania bispinosa]|nr:hypothetical protein SESBI_27350 [Sesbania bispinosa]